MLKANRRPDAIAKPATVEPVFIAGTAGRLFAVYYPPRSAAGAASVVILPPFAEEMNRCRRMMALQARTLAAQGRGALILDPYGCGDSEGEFAEARWEFWRADAAAAIEWMRRRGHPHVSLLGIRLGALLALDVAARQPVDRVVLWQPVPKGDQAITQFLRLRLAAALGAGGAGDENVSNLRARLAAGEALEIAGYALAPELAAAIDSLALAELGQACPAPIEWIEIAVDVAQPLTRTQQQIIERCRESRLRFNVRKAQGEPFWTLQETTVAPAVIAATAEAFETA